MESRKKWMFLGIVSFSLLSIVFTFIFNQKAPPVSALEIPQSTKDYFKKLGDLGHIKFDFVDSLDLGDFDNASDYSTDFSKLEDDNFVIYYRNKPEEAKRAKQTLDYANQAIPQLASFFGRFYYAKDVRNHKLPIYLAVSSSDFSGICDDVGGSTVDWAAGLTFNSVSFTGDKLCLGIVLNGSVRDGETTDLKKVIFHEMAHYNHFQCIDFLRKGSYMNWEIEGLASYFARDWNERIPSGTNLSSFSLQHDPDNYLDSYWMGYHAFNVADESGSFKSILASSYTNSLMAAIPENASCTMDQFDEKWRKHCNSILSKSD
jgi:hypothetical protein